MDYSGKPLYVSNPLKSYQYFTQAVMEKSNNEMGFYPKFDLRAGTRDILRSAVE
ncbi:MAG: hypothetical protein QW100_01960 [Thermoplasmatales archaeon]